MAKTSISTVIYELKLKWIQKINSILQLAISVRGTQTIHGQQRRTLHELRQNWTAAENNVKRNAPCKQEHCLLREMSHGQHVERQRRTPRRSHHVGETAVDWRLEDQCSTVSYRSASEGLSTPCLQQHSVSTRFHGSHHAGNLLRHSK